MLNLKTFYFPLSRYYKHLKTMLVTMSQLMLENNINIL